MRIRPVRFAQLVQVLLLLDHLAGAGGRVQQLPGDLLREVHGALLLASRLHQPAHRHKVRALLRDRYRHLIRGPTALDRHQLQQRTTILDRPMQNAERIRVDGVPVVGIGQMVALQLDAFDVLEALDDELAGQTFLAAAHHVVGELGQPVVVEERRGVIVAGRLDGHVRHALGFAGFEELRLSGGIEDGLNEVRTVRGHGGARDAGGRRHPAAERWKRGRDAVVGYVVFVEVVAFPSYSRERRQGAQLSKHRLAIGTNSF